MFLGIKDVFFTFQEALTIEQMTRYASPINPAVFPHLTIVLLSIGIFFMAWFFVYPLIYTCRVLVPMKKRFDQREQFGLYDAARLQFLVDFQDFNSFYRK